MGCGGCSKGPRAGGVSAVILALLVGAGSTKHFRRSHLHLESCILAKER